MLIETTVISLIVGKIRGGKLSNIGKIELKAWYLFIVGFVLEFASIYFSSQEVHYISNFIEEYFVFIHGTSYVLILIALIINFKHKSMILVFIGTLLNFLVIILNGGQMPVSEAGLKSAGLLENLQMLIDKKVITHTLINETTKLEILGDIITIPKPYPLPKLISIGDIFLAIGIFLFLQKAMKYNNSIFKREDKILRFGYKSKI